MMANLGNEKLQIKMELMITFHFSANTISAGGKLAICCPRP